VLTKQKIVHCVKDNGLNLHIYTNRYMIWIGTFSYRLLQFGPKEAPETYLQNRSGELNVIEFICILCIQNRFIPWQLVMKYLHLSNSGNLNELFFISKGLTTSQLLTFNLYNIHCCRIQKLQFKCHTPSALIMKIISSF